MWLFLILGQIQHNILSNIYLIIKLSSTSDIFSVTIF